jgi:DNA-directed RNA polymerase subunit RPC12/RpoP
MTFHIGSYTHNCGYSELITCVCVNCGYREIVKEYLSSTVSNPKEHSSRVSLTHSGVYTCEICGKAFSSNDELTKHVDETHERKMIVA